MSSATVSMERPRLSGLGRFGLALLQQFAVIRALILREARTRYVRNRIGYAWAILEPSTHILIWFGIISLLNRGAYVHDMPPLLFIATGLIPLFMFRNVASFVTSATNANKGLMAFPLVKDVDAMVSRFFLESAAIILVAILIFGGVVFFEVAEPPRDLLALIAVSFSLLFLGFGWGVLFSGLRALFPFFDHVDSIIGRILYFTSGIFFVYETMPSQLQEWMWWNPALHGTELFRTGWSYTYTTPMGDIWYILGFGLVCLYLGLLLLPRVRWALENK